MEFDWGNQRRYLQGISLQSLQTASPTEISKEIWQGNEAFAICLHTKLEEALRAVPTDMQQLLKDYEEIFQEPTKLPPSRGIDHYIPLKKGVEPVNVRPYCYVYFQKAEIEKQVEEMLRSGLIRSNTSSFSSPVLLVKKTDGSWWFCTDYQTLNEVTIKDRFPIPTVEDMLDELHGAASFTKLDLRAGYHQLRVNPPDIHKTAFRIHNEHYEYLVNSIFRLYLRKFILVFFDDILIYSASWSSHLEHVKQALEVLKQQQLFIKISKCNFGQQEMEYLGHIVTCDGKELDERKVAAMVSWPQPQNR
ncbi:hypothetical protein WN944_001963 [Citrus x changshan-huyou]|uniref:Reverse transcriptase domain-containing protein n=1 Tax=Citrus x changshan-huyou TaxID=2935761 RepID=A0AAP0MKS5_9ROSI